MNLLSVLFPRVCVSCKTWGTYLCLRCENALEHVTTQICPICERPAIDGKTHPPCTTRYTIDGLISAVVYAGSARALVHELKFRYVADIGSILIEELLRALLNNRSSEKEIIRDKPVVIPIPLHKRRENWRGFNQAEILACLIAKKLGYVCDTEILVRKKHTQQQATLPVKERRNNLGDAFLVTAEKQLVGKGVILVDDVWTTGSTMRSAASVLKRAGARSVWGLVYAR